MATTPDYMEYVADQLGLLPDFRYRKMFGEYGVYCGDLIFGVVCDNCLYIKITEAGKALLPDCLTGPPYRGAGRPMFVIENLEDRELLARVVAATCAELPPPKPKKKR